MLDKPEKWFIVHRMGSMGNCFKTSMRVTGASSDSGAPTHGGAAAQQPDRTGPRCFGEDTMSRPLITNLDLHKLSAADFEHFDRTDGLSEEEEAQAAEEVERQIDQWVEEHGDQI